MADDFVRLDASFQELATNGSNNMDVAEDVAYGPLAHTLRHSNHCRGLFVAIGLGEPLARFINMNALND